MTNIRKSFNFRNGLQVDDDNFIINPNGLVGIGTSVPTELLDVRGTVKVVGLVTASQIYTTSLVSISATITNLTLGNLNVGTGVTIGAGIVTATNGFNSGIGTAVQIATIGNILTFTVPGVGSTSLTLY